MGDDMFDWEKKLEDIFFEIDPKEMERIEEKVEMGERLNPEEQKLYDYSCSCHYDLK
jgi:hypothetical protein